MTHQAGSGRTFGPGAFQASGNAKKTLCMGVSGSVQEQTTHACAHTNTCGHTCMHTLCSNKHNTYRNKCTCTHTSTHRRTYMHTRGESWGGLMCGGVRLGSRAVCVMDRGEEGISGRAGGPCARGSEGRQRRFDEGQWPPLDTVSV